LKGTAHDIYRYLLTSDKPLGIREIQRALDLSSPSVAQYHLTKLEHAGLLKKEAGNYAVNKVMLENCIRISNYLIPRYLFYSVFAIVVLLIELIFLWPVELNRDYLFSTICNYKKMIYSLENLLFASEQNPSKISSATAISNVDNGIQLSMTLDTNKTVFESGKEINITFALTNTSNQTRQITLLNADPRIFNFFVFNSNDTRVFAYRLGLFIPINDTITLASNESYKETLTWNQSGFEWIKPTQISTGHYYIIGFIANNTQSVLETERLNITITKN